MPRKAKFYWRCYHCGEKFKKEYREELVMINETLNHYIEETDRLCGPVIFVRKVTDEYKHGGCDFMSDEAVMANTANSILKAYCGIFN